MLDFPGTPVQQRESWFIRPLETTHGVRSGAQRVTFDSRWTFALNASQLLRAGSIFFFELLQRCPPINGPSAQAFYIRVGWSFLRPDLAALNDPISYFTLNCYSYERRLPKAVGYEADAAIMRAHYVKDTEIHQDGPSVFYEFAWPTRKEQDSTLSVSLELVGAAHAFNDTSFHETAQAHDLAPEMQQSSDNKLAQCVIQKADMTAGCPIPDEVMHIFPTGDHGCFRMCLSTSGTYLVAACDGPSAMYELRMYDLALGSVYCVFEGHSALVYDVVWLSNDSEELVLSCSGDGRVLIFTVPPNTTDLPVTPNVCLYHPSHVYSCRTHPMATDPTRIVLACGGFGFGFRLWQIERRMENGQYVETMSKAVSDFRTEDKSDVYCLRFSRGENMITAHADGYLVLWKVTIGATAGESIQCQQIKVYRNPDFAGTSIYHFDIITTELLRRSSSTAMQVADDWILLHTKDNLIRICSLQQTIVRVMSEFPVKNSRFGCRGVISPSGEYLILGCETGKVFIFSTDGTCEPVDWVPMRLGSPICDIVWSRRHNLIAICAYESDEPPIVVFYFPREISYGSLAFRPANRPMDTRQSLTVDNAQDRVSTSTGQWALNWLDVGSGGPLGLKKKQELKASVLGQVMDRKSHADIQASIARKLSM